MTSLYHIRRTGDSRKEEPPLIRLGGPAIYQPTGRGGEGEIEGIERKKQNIEEGEKIKAYGE